MYGLSNHEVTAGGADFDGDGLSDAAEFAALASDPTKADSDNDGLSDGQEFELGTQPQVADSDGDGLSDGQEVSSYKIADSIEDFTTDGTQGTNGWISGYRNTPQTVEATIMIQRMTSLLLIKTAIGEATSGDLHHQVHLGL